MFQIPYRVPYRTKVFPLILGIILSTVGGVFFSDMAMANTRRFTINLVPVTTQQMSVIFWVITGICGLCLVTCLVGAVRQKISPSFFEITNSAVIFTKGKEVAEIPLHAITKVQKYGMRSYSRTYEISVVISAYGKAFVISKAMLPSANDYEQVKQHLFGVVANRGQAPQH